jgi:hypothetical protein
MRHFLLLSPANKAVIHHQLYLPFIKYVGSNFSAFKACQLYSCADKLKSVFSMAKGRESGEPIITYRRRASGRMPI